MHLALRFVSKSWFGYNPFMSISSVSKPAPSSSSEEIFAFDGDLPLSGSDEVVIDQLLEHYVAEMRSRGDYERWIVWPSETGG